MKFKLLTTDEELDQYRKITNGFIDVLLPLNYLKRSRVIAVVNKNDEIRGGFVIVMQGPFRTLQSIPKKTDAINEHLKGNIGEITGLWLDPRLKSARSSLKFWLRLYWELISSGKSDYVYAYSLRKPKLGRLYKAGRPKILFRGQTKQMDGMSMPEKESVEIVNMKKLALAPLLNPKFLLGRLWGSRRPSMGFAK